MRNLKERVFGIIVAICFVLPLLAGVGSMAEGDWYCPHCGRLNHDNFCPVDGTKKPDDLEPAEVTQVTTPAPEAEVIQPTVTEAAVSKKKELPFLQDVYQGETDRLNVQDKEHLIQAYTGPGREYAGAGAYQADKQNGLTVYFNENGWVLTDISYLGAEERYVYFPEKMFRSYRNIPRINRLSYAEGTVTETVLPSWGPERKFNVIPALEVSQGTKIKAFFQQNGFVYAEFASVKGTVRMWLPADKVSIPGMNLTYTSEPGFASGTSLYGQDLSGSELDRIDPVEPVPEDEEDEDYDDEDDEDDEEDEEDEDEEEDEDYDDDEDEHGEEPDEIDDENDEDDEGDVGHPLPETEIHEPAPDTPTLIPTTETPSGPPNEGEDEDILDDDDDGYVNPPNE